MWLTVLISLFFAVLLRLMTKGFQIRMYEQSWTNFSWAPLGECLLPCSAGYDSEETQHGVCLLISFRGGTLTQACAHVGTHTHTHKDETLPPTMCPICLKNLNSYEKRKHSEEHIGELPIARLYFLEDTLPPFGSNTKSHSLFFFGNFNDFSVWLLGTPILISEAL